MFYFENPLALFLLLLIPAYLFWYIFWYPSRRLEVHLSYSPEQIIKTKRIWKWLPWVTKSFLLIALALMIIALARPRVILGLANEELVGLDIMLLVDISASMEEADLNPNRLEVAKQTLVRLVQERKNDFFGMIVFSQDAYSLFPLTHDHDFAINEIKNLSTELLPKEGTALGNAIALAVNRLKDSGSDSKLILALTDGVHNTGLLDPLNSAASAASAQIPIFTVLVGKQDSALLALDSQKSLKNEVDVKKAVVDQETLEKIAQITEGYFFQASDHQNLELLLYHIDRIKAKNQKIIENQEIKDVYNWFTIPALFSLMIAFGLMALGFYNILEGT